MINFKFLFALAVFFTVAFGKRPNIVIIVVDDLGWGDVSFHGSRQIATPNIDALASDSIILNNYYVNPMCSPTRSALLTGRHPVQTGMQQGVVVSGEPWGLPLSVRILPQWLKKLNYSTVGVGKWHLGFHRKSFIPTERGFDRFFGFWNALTDYYTRTTLNWQLKNITTRGIDFHNNAEHEDVAKFKGIYGTDMYTQKAVDAIVNHQKTNDGQPLFLYFAHQGVHWPIQSPEKYQKRFEHIKDKKKRKFAGQVSAVDDSVARVMEALVSAKIINNTIVLLTTDNGGASYEQSPVIVSNLPLRGCKASLWEGGVRANAFIWSQLLPKKYVSQQLMDVTDIPTTLYKAAGGNVHDLGSIEGKDLWETLKMNLTSPRKHLLHNIESQGWAVRAGDFKLTTATVKHNKIIKPIGINDPIIYRNMTDGWSPDPEHSPVAQVLANLNKRKIQPVKVLVNCGQHKNLTSCKPSKKVCLFDIRNDPCELNDISDGHPDVVQRLTRLFLQYNATAVPSGKRPYDPKSNPKLHNGRWGVWLD